MARQAQSEIIAILHNIRSIHNVGSMFRTADAAGISKIYVTGITPTPLDRFGAVRKDFHKVSLGAEHSVPWERVRSATALMRRLRKEGYRVFAVEQEKNSVPYYEASPFDLAPSTRLRTSQGKNQRKLALIFGNETCGLPPSILKRADEILEIPMHGAMVRQAHHPRRTGRGKESLNVSVAFGVVVFGLLREK